MKKIDLEVTPRTDTGKGPNRRLRAQGRVPAVIYGSGQAPEKVSVDAHIFGKLTAKGTSDNVLFNLIRPGQTDSTDTVAVVRELQRDPVTRRFLHIDLHSIRMDVESEFEIPVGHTGTPVGVREGGILESHRYVVLVRCLPAALPDKFIVDITNLKINHAIHASDLTLPEGVKLVDEPATVLFTVLPPKAEAAPTPAEGAAAEPAVPEVIGKKKTDEETAAEAKEKK